jgi:small nuclear ribonucleoprotein F
LSFATHMCFIGHRCVVYFLLQSNRKQIVQTQFIVNPKPFLVDLTGQQVKVKLKWGTEYMGKLESADAYMNLLLTGTEEYIDGECAGELGEVLIRCNNVLYIVAAPTRNNNKKAEDAVMMAES